ncbi:uncharacterized protein PADG_08377 [Paracoccidioides brasiliensis Pb18]|uniref:Tf2-1-like SH3-like domain-containing protein n=1 Tax=Paracoccidioides brasiliensis (strain Pb18) TaxID=502780 RepID=C1GLY6_PARBD|nr:uncharacterized protein PADG_08377 [Paracoccidioides brasiliensis Pb18]EEH43452.2 hypothetical protein PADG_08377 [Paracoccidioides brasiliensis Pb18]
MKLPLLVSAFFWLAPVMIFALPPGMWEKCAYSLWCLDSDECRQTYDCWYKALDHNLDYIFCNIGVYEPHKCWVYASAILALDISRALMSHPLTRLSPSHKMAAQNTDPFRILEKVSNAYRLDLPIIMKIHPIFSPGQTA